MGADGAYGGRVGADVDVAAVAADPDLVANAGEDLGLLNILQEGEIALLMQLLDGGDALELLGQGLEALLARGLGEAGVHVGPLVVLTLGGELEVLGRGADLAAVKLLIPELGVLLLIGGGLREDGGELLIAVLLGLRGVVFILDAGLALSGKGGLEICPGLASFEFHKKTSLR